MREKHGYSFTKRRLKRFGSKLREKSTALKPGGPYILSTRENVRAVSHMLKKRKAKRKTLSSYSKVIFARPKGEKKGR